MAWPRFLKLQDFSKVCETFMSVYSTTFLASIY